MYIIHETHPTKFPPRIDVVKETIYQSQIVAAEL